MTQPQAQAPPWISELIKRYSGAERPERPLDPYQPMGFDYERNPFDPSSYYNNLNQIQNISQAGTRVLQTKIANQQRMEEEKRIAQLQERLANMQIQPKFTQSGQGNPRLTSTKKGAFGTPLGSYNVSSGYGHRNRPTRGASTFHQGVDMAAPSGSPIYATHDGIIANAGWSSGYGWNVAINGGGGVQTFYGHQSKLAVKSGQRVQRGQIIGYVGSTGISTGPHLHYGVKVNGQFVNPTGYY